MAIKARIIRIGKSWFIRIPGRLLERAHLTGNVELCVEPGRLVVRSAHQPRQGWAEENRRMHERGHDRLLDEPTPTTRFDEEEWDW